jgi:EmrB/QacA subfamily drug resistance transporter
MTDANETAKRWVLALASAASFIVVLDSLVVATALSAIRRDLGASIEALEWTVNAYNLSFAVLLLTGAVLGDRLGRRRMFGFGLALFIAASAACALSTNAYALIAARAVQGAGGALVMPLAMALLSAAYPPQERAKALGLYSGLIGIALITGPVLGGAVVEGLNWQWIFWINLPLGLVVIPLIRTRIAESFGTGSRVDLPGVVLVTGAALGIVWGLMRANHAGWTSPEVLSAFVLGFGLAIAFIAVELRAKEPMVPMRFFRSRAFSASVGASFLFYAAMYGVLFFLPQFLQTGHGYGPFAAGLRLLPWTATLFVISPIAGNLTNRIGERPLVVCGLILQAAGMAWIGLIATPDLPYAKLILPLILAGSGVSMAMPAAQNAALGAVARSEIGKASGIFNMFRFLGGVSGIAILVAIFSATGGIASPESFSTGFARAIGVASALSLAAAIAGLCLPGNGALPVAVKAKA